MNNDKNAWLEYEAQQLVGREEQEALMLAADQWEDIQKLKQYINKLEAERDYYQEASSFAGVPNTPQP